MKIQQIHEASALRFVALAVLIGILGTALPAGAVVLVSSFGTDQVLEYNDTTGAFQGVFTTLANHPTSLALGPNGDIYVATIPALDGSTSSILKYKTDGTPDGTFVASLPGSVLSMSFAPDGSLYASTFQSGSQDKVQKFSTAGAPLGLQFGAPPGSGNSPAMAVLPTGGGSYNLLLTDNLYGMDRLTSGTSMISSNFATHGGSEQFFSLSIAPSGKIYMGTANSNLYVLNQPTGFTAFSLVSGTIPPLRPTGLMPSVTISMEIFFMVGITPPATSTSWTRPVLAPFSSRREVAD